MQPIRSVLWIGPAESLAKSGVADAAVLDVTWVCDVDDALALPLSQFDAAVLVGSEPEQIVSALRQMRTRPGMPRVLVCLPEREAGWTRDILAAGASDVLVAFSESEVSEVNALLRCIEQRPDASLEAKLRSVIGRSPALRAALALALRAARSTATVLLCGETGTGKEVLARTIHDQSARAKAPFVAVNCAAFPDTLLESELFGHVKGSFTGAERDKPGLFELANRGTIFLDEIGETSPSLQARMLRVLQEREVRPIGAATARKVDVRVIAATNRDLGKLAARGAFREDLYYRLAVFPIEVPPLRERTPDVIPLAEHFLELYGKREGRPDCKLSTAAAHLLLAHRWPGNVRELENEIQRAIALAEPGETITPRLLSERVLDIKAPPAPAPNEEKLQQSLARVEGWLIRRALDHNAGRRTTTARELGITREGLYKKMKRLGIE